MGVRDALTIHIDLPNVLMCLGGAAYLLVGLFIGIPLLTFVFGDWQIPNIWGAHLAVFLIGWTLWLPILILRLIAALLDPETWN